MRGRVVLAAILIAVLLVAAGSMVFREAPPEDEPDPAPELEQPTSGEALWWGLPAELLSNVAEGKMEEIASCRSCIRQLETDLARVQEIQKIKMAEARPPPE